MGAEFHKIDNKNSFSQMVFMLSQFRISYPKGCLISELVTIDHGKYIVRALVEVEKVTLATGLAAADTIEQAEDLARSRALAVLGISVTTETAQQPTQTVTTDVAKPVASTPVPQIPLIEEKLTQSVQNSDLTNFSQLDSDNISTSELNFSSKDTSNTVISVEESDDSLNDDFSDSTAIAHMEIEASPEANMPVSTTENNLTSSLTSSDNYPQIEPTPLTSGVIDFSEMVARSNIELKRLGWTKQRGVDYLLGKYNKKIRSELTDQELQEFLHYLELQPTPDE
jgi:hypothetical protein